MKRRIDICVETTNSHQTINPVSFRRRNLPHVQRDYRPHFITFCTKERRVLPDWARRIVLDCCTHGHDTIYNLYVAVVMPDHVHMILTPLEDRDRMMISSLSEIMKGIKGTAAHAINRRLGRKGPVWLEESFDSCVADFRKSGRQDRVHFGESGSQGAGESAWGVSVVVD